MPIGAGLLGQGVGGHLLVGANQPLYPSQVATQAGELTDRLAAEPDVDGVTSYWTTGAPTLRTIDGRHALVLAHIRGNVIAGTSDVERVRVGEPAFVSIGRRDPEQQLGALGDGLAVELELVAGVPGSGSST
ncbi:hypothetical protein [Embleya sp. AB8]|uniref:hypothetical protein n=1 Tax=Embleya sp. AB8 TaxID=3156304 RepID=UPI003C7612D1